MIISKSEFSKFIFKDFKKCYEDLYNGKIKASCDEGCDDDCTIDHGYITPPANWANLFDEN